MILLWLACAECPDGFEERDRNCYPAEQDEDPVAALQPELSPVQVLRRTALDLTGVLPSLDAVQAVQADPEALGERQRALVDDPRLEERLVELLGERWHTLVDDFSIQAQELGVEEYPFERSAGEEPLRLMARVGVQERPWSDIVRADFTMANDTLVSVWPLERDDGGQWTTARYLDGRPPAGVLATNGFFWRYRTTATNANRGRAAHIMKLLVCDDMASRPVAFEVGDALVEGGTELAVREQPVCVACHVTLDPAASALFGWYWFEIYNNLEASAYHPEREPLGEEFLGVAGGWYGTPVDGLGSLGAVIADDPRFDACQAGAFAEALWGRELDALEDRALVDDLVEDWRREDLRLRSLLLALVQDPEYAQTPMRPLAADQLGTVVEELTGFRWSSEGFDLLRTDTYGYRTMAGGVDGRFVLTAGQSPSLTWALVVKRLAEGAASYAVEHGTFFTVADAGVSPDEPVFAEQIEAWSWRLTGAPGDPEGLAALWWTVEGSSGPDQAWAAVMTALLRDPELVMY